MAKGKRVDDEELEPVEQINIIHEETGMEYIVNRLSGLPGNIFLDIEQLYPYKFPTEKDIEDMYYNMFKILRKTTNHKRIVYMFNTHKELVDKVMRRIVLEEEYLKLLFCYNLFSRILVRFRGCITSCISVKNMSTLYPNMIGKGIIKRYYNNIVKKPGEMFFIINFQDFMDKFNTFKTILCYFDKTKIEDRLSLASKVIKNFTKIIPKGYRVKEVFNFDE